MKEFAKFFHFVDGRRILYRLTSKNPENMPQCVKGFIKHNEAYEQEAQFIQDETKMSFINSGCCYFALSQLYQFGISPYFPGISVKPNTSRTAYWLLKAFAYHDRQAFVFLHSLVPECFIKDHSTVERLQAIENEWVEWSDYSATPAVRTGLALLRHPAHDMMHA